MSVRNIIHKILDTSKPLLHAGERSWGGLGEGPGAFAWAGLMLVSSLGLKATISMKISKRWVCNGCVYGGASGARAFLSIVSSLYAGSRLGGSVWETGSVVTSLELSWFFGSPRL